MNMKMRPCLPSMLTQAVFYLWCLSVLIRDPPHCGAPVWQPPTCDSLEWVRRGGGGGGRNTGWKEGKKRNVNEAAELQDDDGAVIRWSDPVRPFWYFLSLIMYCTLFFMLSQDCRLAKIWLSIAWTHSSLSSYVDASKFHVWPVNDTMMNSKESSCSGKHNSTIN